MKSSAHLAAALIDAGLDEGNAHSIARICFDRSDNPKKNPRERLVAFRDRADKEASVLTAVLHDWKP